MSTETGAGTPTLEDLVGNAQARCALAVENVGRANYRERLEEAREEVQDAFAPVFTALRGSPAQGEREAQNSTGVDTMNGIKGERCGAVTTLGGAFPPMACTLPKGHAGRHDADSARPVGIIEDAADVISLVHGPTVEARRQMQEGEAELAALRKELAAKSAALDYLLDRKTPAQELARELDRDAATLNAGWTANYTSEGKGMLIARLHEAAKHLRGICTPGGPCPTEVVGTGEAVPPCNSCGRCAQHCGCTFSVPVPTWDGQPQFTREDVELLRSAGNNSIYGDEHIDLHDLAERIEAALHPATPPANAERDVQRVWRCRRCDTVWTGKVSRCPVCDDPECALATTPQEEPHG